MKNLPLFLLTLSFSVGLGQDAVAYIGPGAGLSMLGAFWGLVVAIVAALSFLLLWPIRKAFKKKNANANVSADIEGQDKPAA